LQPRLSCARPSLPSPAAPRRKLSLNLSLQGTSEDVTILDLSSTGMLIETGDAIAPFDYLEVALPEAEPAQALVLWNSGRYYGCEFKNRLSQAVVSAAQLRSAPLAVLDQPPAVPEPAIGPTRIAAGNFDRRAITPAAIPSAPGDFGEPALDREKAPLGVRLRVIFGSAPLDGGMARQSDDPTSVDRSELRLQQNWGAAISNMAVRAGPGPEKL
jgi:hypothetical protein